MPSLKPLPKLSAQPRLNFVPPAARARRWRRWQSKQRQVTSRLTKSLQEYTDFHEGKAGGQRTTDH